jgi:hypothetical protein
MITYTEAKNAAEKAAKHYKGYAATGITKINGEYAVGVRLYERLPNTLPHLKEIDGVKVDETHIGPITVS